MPDKHRDRLAVVILILTWVVAHLMYRLHWIYHFSLLQYAAVVLVGLVAGGLTRLMK